MNRRQLLEFVNQPRRFGVLGTASRDGAANVAIFGSVRMPDETTLAMGLGDNRTLANLKHNPRCVYLVFEPGDTPLSWRGARLYLKVTEIAPEGPLFEEIVAAVTREAGRGAARAIRAAVSFEITEFRPLIDFGSDSPPDR